LAEERSPHSVVVVTGAAGGIGRTICATFASGGARVIGLDRVADGAAPALSSYHRIDLADLSALEPAVERIWSAEGRIDVLVNNAAHLDTTPFADLSPESMVRTLTVNVAAVATLTRAVATRMAAGGGGVVVNLASIAGKRGSSQPLYGASKAGVISLTRTLARVYAPTVRVVGVAPALVEAGMGPGLATEVRGALLAQTPLGRGATAQEVADVVAFLASPAASYISGETVDVHGGL
jgi:NAD(P)-dependent dehydrogenase (short-subunit alcohol dehydrogenase family)